MTVLSFLLAHRAAVDVRDWTGFTALMAATKAGSTDCVQVLLNNGADVDAVTDAGSTSLHIAIDNYHGHLVPLLLERGANPNRQGRFGATPLLRAVVTEQTAVVERLLSCGVPCNCNERDDQYWTPLLYAVKQGNQRVVDLLLEHGADPNTADERGQPVLHHAIGIPPRRGLGIVRLLLAKGAMVNARDGLGNTALVELAMDPEDKPEYFEALVNSGADLDATSPPSGRLDVEFWITDRHNPNEPLRLKAWQYRQIFEAARKREDAFTEAAIRGDVGEVRALLEQGTHVNCRRVGLADQTGLMIAASSNDIEMTKLLLEHHAHVNMTDKEGKTALSLAAERGHAECVRLLLANGADPTIADIIGVTPLELARRSQYNEAVRALIVGYSSASLDGTTKM